MEELCLDEELGSVFLHTEAQSAERRNRRVLRLHDTFVSVIVSVVVVDTALVKSFRGWRSSDRIRCLHRCRFAEISWLHREQIHGMDSNPEV
jgi:hypothetical protein